VNVQAGQNSLSGVLVLGFALFIAGFLTGILAIAVIPLSIDATALGAMYFAIGAIMGIVISVMFFMAWKMRSKRKSLPTAGKP
jgi:membrane protein implicated in regulation of membrane protease activity